LYLDLPSGLQDFYAKIYTPFNKRKQGSKLKWEELLEEVRKKEKV
jgi:hypothetical protein